MNFNAEIEVDLSKLKYNVRTLKDAYSDYFYMVANVKNNAFGMGYKIVDTLVNNGITHLVVSTLFEALEIRKMNTDVNIIVSGEMAKDFIYDAVLNNITITISSLDNLASIANLTLKDKLKIHLLIDNGCNKIGLKSKEEVNQAVQIIDSNANLILEGVYTELTTYGILDEDFYHSFDTFFRCICDIKDRDIMIHLNEPIMYHKKNSLVNGIRFDLSLLGIEENIDDGIISNLKIKSVEKKYNDLEFPDIDLSLIFAIKAQVIGLAYAKKGSLIGRNYIAYKDMKLAILPIGHKDGITRALGTVNVEEMECPIVADEIDHLIIESPNDLSVGEMVYILNDDKNIYDVLGLLRTNRFYLMSILNNDLPRIYLNGEEMGENVL